MIRATTEMQTAIQPLRTFPAFWRRVSSIFARFHSPVPGLHPARCSESCTSERARSCEGVDWIGIEAHLVEIENRLRATYHGGDLGFICAAGDNAVDLSPVGHLLALDIPFLLQHIRANAGTCICAEPEHKLSADSRIA